MAACGQLPDDDAQHSVPTDEIAPAMAGLTDHDTDPKSDHRQERRGPRLWVILAWIVCLAGIGAGGYYYYRMRTDAGAPPAAAATPPGAPVAAGPGPGGPPGAAGPVRPTPVVATRAQSADVPIWLKAIGSVAAANTVTVRSRVDGQLMRVLFSEGQMVKAGDLLAEVDPRAYQAQLEQAEGQLARDTALLENARIDLQRYRTLFKQDSIAKQQVDTQEALVRQYEGTVKVDKGQVDNARLQLSYARITAPISGRIGLRAVDAGNMIKAGDTNGLATITQVTPISVIFTIAEDNLPVVIRRMREDTAVPVQAFDRSQANKLASGKLVTIDNQIDMTTGTVKLKAEFPNDDGALFPNQFVNVRMLLDVRRNATVIPTAAIQRAGQSAFVYAVTPENRIAVRQIVPGPIEGFRTIVESGLQPGDQVVTDGGDRLREGTMVTVSAPPGDAPTAAAAPPSNQLPSSTQPRQQRRTPDGQRPPGQQPGGQQGQQRPNNAGGGNSGG